MTMTTDRINRLVGLDFETTGTDVATCEVVQAAVVDLHLPCAWPDLPSDRPFPCPRLGDDLIAGSFVSLFKPNRPIPAASSAVHGITDADVAGGLGFASFVYALATYLEDDPDSDTATAVVTFNGRSFDLPILERYLGRPLYVPHVDVYVLWQHLRDRKTPSQVHNWRRDAGAQSGHYGEGWPADIFTGSLQAAHVHQLGHAFGGAHDALVDVCATLDVLAAMIDAGHHTFGEALELSTQPLPGHADIAGKFAWTAEGEAALAFGKHRGVPLRSVPVSYLRWLCDSDFPAETKQIAADAMNGDYLRRAP